MASQPGQQGHYTYCPKSHKVKSTKQWNLVTGSPTGVESIGGALAGVGVGGWGEGTLNSILKILVKSLKNTYQGVRLLKLLAISL